MRKALRVVVALTAFACPVAAGACGSRTGLLVPPPSDASTVDRSSPDSSEEPDVPLDAEASFDAPDVQDVIIPDGPDICPDSGATLVYVITESNDLYSFYPPTLAFTLIGRLSCTANPGVTPFSMAVDRQGIGRSVFSDGTLYLVDMGTAACAPTGFQTGQSGFLTFCMGYAADSVDAGDGGEILYVAECSATTGPPRPNSRGLATVDTTSLHLRFVAPFTPPIPGPELTGTGDGRLYGFYTNAFGTGSHIVQIDRATGVLLQDFPLQVGTPMDGYAFAFWGGVFWVFTFSGQGLPTIVTRFDPATLSETMVTTMPEGVVGAGVSTCAPM